MPELPEVERARRLAEHTLVGRRIVRVLAAPDAIVYDVASPRRFAAALRGRTVKAVKRKGKYLWFELDRRPWPSFHFGMTGSFRVYEKPSQRPRNLKVELLLDDGTRFAMRDARRFGRIRLHDDPENVPPISRLGFDPLTSPVKLPELRRRLARRKAPIKAVLLDQSLFAGVGNWIADEVLYQARIAPRRLASSLIPAEVGELLKSLRRIIRHAVKVEANYKKFPPEWLFGNRWGLNKDAVTHDRRKIIHETIGGRTTAWVPGYQR